MRYQNVMPDIFDDLFSQEPPDPTEAARRAVRPKLRRRFYKEVGLTEDKGEFALALDGRPVKTPARRALAAPGRALAEALADEWRAQGDTIDPTTMPLTRLANSIIDGVADTFGDVAAEVEKYLASDLVFYRAEHPDRLVAWQARAWDPLLAWAQEAFGARFLTTQGLAHVAQPAESLAAAGAALPRDAKSPNDIWRLGAVHSITTLTGSALIALAVLHGRVSVDDAWAAAHIDEDWNMEQWGHDAIALERRAYRFAEMQAAARVLSALR
jgi:chaperone required for assembly of F1-ATPase